MHKRRTHPKEWVEESLALKPNVVPPLCGVARPSLDKETAYQPQKKRCYNAHQSPNITHYIAGVGPLDNINERGPHLPLLMYRRL